MLINNTEKEALVTLMLPRIRQLANYYQRNIVGMEFEDLMNEGALIVLLKADKFDANRKANIETMLTLMIRNHFHVLYRKWRKRPLPDTFEIQESCMGHMSWERAEILAENTRDELSPIAGVMFEAYMGERTETLERKTDDDLGTAVGISRGKYWRAKREIRDTIAKETL